MQWIDVQQNTDEWFQLRAGKIGGSSIGCIMANYGKAFGPPAHKLACKLAIERITGKPILSTHTNHHMERGHEQEPIARRLYEELNFCEVQNGGFYDCGNVGFSPDGRVYSNGLIEIKSVEYHVQIETIKRGMFDPTYKWQLYLPLKYSDRDWIDYISFCSDFPEDKQLFIDRVFRKDCTEYFNMIQSRLELFEKLIEDKACFV